ncbi:MAG TPA: rod shape-determining protein MreC [Vicinamibacterales bacterium]|nr:rod shape-determining protein MreC [Vicinamibacterales bacterium]
MAILDLRQRSGYLFLAVALGHILLISAQVSSRTGVPVLEAVTFGGFAEIQRALSSSVGSVRHVWNNYAGLRQVQRENDELKQELAAARVDVQEQRALADRSRGLEKLLDMRERTPLQTVAAEIIGAAATPDFRTLTLDKGSRDGLKADMAVISPAGVIGRVVVSSPRAAKVQLLVDRNAAAGALIERSRAQGVVVGGEDGRLSMEYVNEVADVVVGDLVVTSGIDGIFPKGFVIGRVEVVDKSGGAYKRIVVRPAADSSAIEEVLVVVTPPAAREPGAEGGA